MANGRVNPWVIAMTVTLATFMEALDTSIANVALPHIAGAMGASQDESTWVITSYLVSNAVVLPISAYLTTLVGRKRFYMTCVALFGISSLLCGLAPTLPLLLFCRVLQGAGGGGLGPSEQAILADTFPQEQRGQAFALYGLAVVVAPALGPTLGGWISDNYSWRWIFFINIPIAILSLYLTHRLIEDPPQLKKEVAEAKRGNFDFDVLGFSLVAVAFGSLEVVLDKGQEDDWFGSTFIRIFFIAFVVGLVGFVIWELRRIGQGRKAIVDLRIFKNRNLSISFFLMFMVGVSLYAMLTMLPQLLQNLMGYTAQLAGEAMSLGGLATMASMVVVGILVNKMDPRWLAVFGFAFMGGALIYCAGLNLQINFAYASELRVYQSIGISFLFIPCSTLAYVGVKPQENNDVSGMINLARNVGGSCGTSLFTTMLARHQQIHQHYLVRFANQSHQAYTSKISTLTQQALATLASDTDAQHKALMQFYQQLQNQASLLSYLDILRFLGILALITAPVALLLKPAPKGTEIVAH